MGLSRRDLLRLSAAATLASTARVTLGCSDQATSIPTYRYDGPTGPETLFSHGVASGDPTSAAVVIWTRVSVDGPDAVVPVFWEVARDAQFSRRIGAGEVETTSASDFTVKLDVAGLPPDTPLYYRFWSLGRVSPLGRTRTAPRGAVDRLRFGVASCASYARGYFHGYRYLAERDDLAAVIFLGDYIYEQASRSDDPRTHHPEHELVTLTDYRQRYAQYRGDPDLQALHQRHPMIAVWDDHETVNNAWSGGSEAHDPERDGDWEARKAAALRAWSEWIPARITDPAAPERIYRRLAFGDLVDLMMLDTRLVARSEQVDRTDFEALSDPARSLLGADQRRWLFEQLDASRATWRLVGQQVMMGQFKIEPTGPETIALNPDQWDGYRACRDRLFRHLKQQGIDNVVVLTGDFHSSLANDLVDTPDDPAVYDPANGRFGVAVECVVPSITNGGAEGALPLMEALLANGPHMRWIDVTHRGYVVLDITVERVQAAWFHIDDVASATSDQRFAKAFAVRPGEPTWVEESDPA